MAESLANFELKRPVSNLIKYTDKIFLYQSKDDDIVPFTNVEKYKQDLPNAKLLVFENRGHFNQEEFPELVENLFNIKDSP